jgi:hypothetical protein
MNAIGLANKCGFSQPFSSDDSGDTTLFGFMEKKNWSGEYVQLNFLSLLHDSTLRKLVNIICVIVLLTATLLQ